MVFSALTEGEGSDVVMLAGGDHGFESCRKLHGRWNPYTARRARSLLREILSPSRVELLELIGAIEKMEDLVRRCCGRRDAQGNAHTLAEDIRMSSLEALLPDDLEKKVQLNRARLNSYDVLSEEIKTYCECRGHANARNMEQKGSSHPGGDDPMDIGAFGKARANRGKGKHGKGNTDETGVRTRTRTRIRLNVGTLESADTTRKTVGARRTPKVVRKENTNPRMQMLTILTREPSIADTEVEIDEFTMSYLDVDALQQQESERMRGSEWIKIGVDTGAGKTAWPQSITNGKTIPGDSDLTFRTATGELVKGGKRMHVVGWGRLGSQFPSSKAPVCKPLLSVGEHTTMGGVNVLYGDKGYMFHRGFECCEAN